MHETVTSRNEVYERSAQNLLGRNWQTNVIFVNENENGEKRENNEFVNEN